jgi:uncharacterized protein YjeT (DUF2065 family)
MERRWNSIVRANTRDIEEPPRHTPDVRHRSGGGMQRLTFVYLGSYLVIGGLGFLLAPEWTLRLLFAQGSYGDVMPRLVGVFMAALGGAVIQFLRAGDYRYYGYTIAARVFIVAALTALYLTTGDPLFVAMDAIVLLGLIPSIYVAAREQRS